MQINKRFLVVFYLIFLIFVFNIVAASQTICLNMIVKNESDVIKRCLASLLPIIDYWVIVDTGSTDGTQKIIKEYMQMNGIPGELHERPWVNFGHNRNEALKLAKGKADYIVFIDADEYLVYDSDFKLPILDKDYYYINFSHSGSSYKRIKLINNKLDWEWVGVLHEVIVPPVSRSYGHVEKVVNVCTTEGARSKDPEKYRKDAQILEAALKQEPENGRYVFYLAQSYRDAGDYALALQNYEKRVAMQGWDEEVFWSLYQIGVLQEQLGMPAETIVNSYKKSYEYRKSRIEPLYQLARFFREQRNFQLGYQIAKIAQTIPISNDLLFIQQWVHDYGILFELSICAYWVEKYEECQQISLELLKRKDLPSNIRACVENNLGFANSKLVEQICKTRVK